MTNIIEIQQEIKEKLGKKEVLNALIATTFKWLSVPQVYMAIQEGVLRGFKFEDFLEKNVYAIPFRDTYSLITSIDFARKVGMRSGVVGKSKPEFEEKDGKIISCTVTIKRKVGDYVGDYTSTAYFSEYSTGRNLWATKPRTMLAKVAEMQALRMACPEEMAKTYVEEEIQKEEKPEIDINEFKLKLEATKSEPELKKVWIGLPAEAKKELEEVKSNLKKQYEKEETKK